MWKMAVVALSDLNLNVFKWGNCRFLICLLGLSALIFLQWNLNWWSLVPAENELF
jgi:hypothetical protein